MLYLDTSCLVKLYYPEPESVVVAKVVVGEVIIFTELHDLELTTAMQLKVFRGEAKLEHVTSALGLVREDLASGKLSRRDVNLQRRCINVVEAFGHSWMPLARSPSLLPREGNRSEGIRIDRHPSTCGGSR